MTPDLLQDSRTNPELYPAYTITDAAKIYGYARQYLRNLVEWGFVSSHKTNFSNRTVILVHTKSLNVWVRRQQKRRNS